MWSKLLSRSRFSESQITQSKHLKPWYLKQAKVSGAERFQEKQGLIWLCHWFKTFAFYDPYRLVYLHSFKAVNINIVKQSL